MKKIQETHFLAQLWRWHIPATLRLWHAPLILALFAGMGYLGGRYLQTGAATMPHAPNVWDGVMIALGGDGVLRYSFRSLMIWFLPYLIFFYIFGDVVRGELDSCGQWVLPAIGARISWWAGKVAILMLLASGYTLLALAGASLGASLALPIELQVSDFFRLDYWPNANPNLSLGALLAWWILCSASTLLALSLIQSVIALLLKSSFYGLLCVITILLGSWFLGLEQSSLVRWLPGSQAMILRHTFFDPFVRNFSLTWSLIYNALLSLIAIGVGSHYMRDLEIAPPTQA